MWMCFLCPKTEPTTSGEMSREMFMSFAIWKTTGDTGAASSGGQSLTLEVGAGEGAADFSHNRFML